MAESNNSTETATFSEPKQEVTREKNNKLFTKKYFPVTPDHNTCRDGRKYNRDMKVPIRPKRETLRSEVEHVHGQLHSQATTAPVWRGHSPEHHSREKLSPEEQLRCTELLLEQVIEARSVLEKERMVDRKRLFEVEIDLKEEQRLSYEQEEELRRLRTHIRKLNLSTQALPPEVLDKSIYMKKTKEDLIKDLTALQGVYAAKTHELQAERLRADILNKKLEEVRFKFHEAKSTDLKETENLKVEIHARLFELERQTFHLELTRQLRDEHVEALKTQLEESTSTGLLLTSKLTAQEEANQELRRKIRLLKGQMNMDEGSEGAVCLDKTAGVDAPEKVQQTAEEIQQTADSVLETAVKYQETVEEVLETAEEVQETAEEQPETAEKILEIAVNMEETPKKPSLWRRFKKFLTPKHRRKYKQQQERDQDQE